VIHLPVDLEVLKGTITFDFVTLLKYALVVGKKIGKKEAFMLLGDVFAENRVNWYKENKEKIPTTKTDIEKAYFALYEFLRFVTPDWRDDYMKIIDKSDKHITIEFSLWCPFLEAAKILDIDTEELCPLVSARASTAMFKEINEKLSMEIVKTRPKYSKCIEMIKLE
jgi:hypothetical protein